MKSWNSHGEKGNANCWQMNKDKDAVRHFLKYNLG